MRRLSGRPDPITWACLSGSTGQIGRSERLEAWEGFEVGEIFVMLALKMEERLCGKEHGWLRLSRWQPTGTQYLSPTTTKNRLQSQSWELGRGPWAPEESMAWVMPWMWPCQNTSRKASWPIPGLWPTELPDHEWMFKAAKTWGNLLHNRKLKHALLAFQK